MIDLIKKYCEFAKVNKDAEIEFVNALSTLLSDAEKANSLNDLIAQYQADVSNCEKVVEELKSLFQSVGVHEYTANVISYILLIPALKKEYEKRNIDNEIFKNTILDMSFHINYCKTLKGVWGTFTSWHLNFFTLKSFGIGRLQFFAKFFEEDFVGENISVKTGEPFLDVHIPNTGTPLTVEACEQAYKEASEFFKEHFNGKPIIFSCESWLVWHKHFEILSPSSNIYKFASRYTIVKKKLFKDAPWIWRIFNAEYNGNLDNLKPTTSLQRIYYDLIKNGEELGWDTGIFIYE